MAILWRDKLLICKFSFIFLHTIISIIKQKHWDNHIITDFDLTHIITDFDLTCYTDVILTNHKYPIVDMFCSQWSCHHTLHQRGTSKACLRYDFALTNPFLQSKPKLYISIEHNKILFNLYFYFFIRQVEWFHDATQIILFDIINLFIERCSDKLSRNQPSSVYTEEIWCVYCRWGFSSFTSGMFRTVILCW